MKEKELSHLLQMRGLKPPSVDGKVFSPKSHLLQMRGLKQKLLVYKIGFDQSHLLQMRGLKLNILIPRTLITEVASFTDAWIETAVMARLKDAGLSHLLQMRGLKQPQSFK